MGIGIGRFFPGKMGFKPLGLGFGHWEWEKNVKNQKGMGKNVKNQKGEWDLRIGEWDLRIAKCKRGGKWSFRTVLVVHSYSM